MAQFELDQLTKCKIVEVMVLSQKNRQPDEHPGAKLSVEMSLGNDMLAYFDGLLKSFLFTKNGGPGGQKGLELSSDAPDLTKIAARIGAFHWDHEMTGYTLEIDLGLGGPSNLTIAGCTLSNWRLHAKDGGTVQTKFDIESADVTKAAFGELAAMKSREMEVLLTPPDPAAQPAGANVDGPWPFPKSDAAGTPPAHLTEPKVTKAARKKAEAAAGSAH